MCLPTEYTRSIQTFNFPMVYQDHLTKFVVLLPLQRKSADEVVNHLLDIFSLFGFSHILQSDNGRGFKNINPATLIRDKWPECKIVHGKPRHPQSQGSVERVNKDIKKVLMVQCLCRCSMERGETFRYNFPYHQHVRVTCGRLVVS